MRRGSLRDGSLFFITLLALCVEVLYLLNELRVIDVPIFNYQTKTTHNVIGQIIEKKEFA